MPLLQQGYVRLFRDLHDQAHDQVRSIGPPLYLYRQVPWEALQAYAFMIINLSGGSGGGSGNTYDLRSALCSLPSSYTRNTISSGTIGIDWYQNSSNKFNINFGNDAYTICGGYTRVSPKNYTYFHVSDSATLLSTILSALNNSSLTNLPNGNYRLCLNDLNIVTYGDMWQISSYYDINVNDGVITRTGYNGMSYWIETSVYITDIKEIV